MDKAFKGIAIDIELGGEVMPRYPLIMDDELYTKLVFIAREKKLSLGKLINTILREYADAMVKELEKSEKHGGGSTS